MNDATTKVDVELNTNAEKVESWKSQIHMLIDVAKWLEHRLSSMNKVAIEDCLQKLAIATHPIVWFRCTNNNQHARKRFDKRDATKSSQKTRHVQNTLEDYREFFFFFS